jgi:hypothetical protein
MGEERVELVDLRAGIGDAHVLVSFPDPVAVMALEPYQARSLALMLWRLARELDVQLREGDATPTPGGKRC